MYNTFIDTCIIIIEYKIIMCMYIINASEIYNNIISPYQGLGYARLVENANEWRINLTQSYLPNLECLALAFHYSASRLHSSVEAC